MKTTQLTHSNTTEQEMEVMNRWADFKGFIESEGFVPALVYSFNFTTEKFKSIISEEEAILYYHPVKGLVIWATSYSGKTVVNEAKLYGQLKYPKPLLFREVGSMYGMPAYKDLVMTDEFKEDIKVLNGCSHNPISHLDEGMPFDLDIRSDFTHQLRQIEAKLDYVPVWVKSPFLWFVDYMETKTTGYDSAAINLAKIEKCPAEFQQIVNVYVQSKK